MLSLQLSVNEYAKARFLAALSLPQNRKFFAEQSGIAERFLPQARSLMMDSAALLSALVPAILCILDQSLPLSFSIVDSFHQQLATFCSSSVGIVKQVLIQITYSESQQSLPRTQQPLPPSASYTLPRFLPGNHQNVSATLRSRHQQHP